MALQTMIEKPLLDRVKDYAASAHVQDTLWLDLLMNDIIVELERLTLENWQLKGALGYPVPGHIPCGDFKCGLCEARHIAEQAIKP